MTYSKGSVPDNTAVRTALWRALHVELDSPAIFEDRIGLELVSPEEGWRDRPDMSAFTRPFRASIVARARFVEDLVAEQITHGLSQYVILGAGLDTFAQRKPDLLSDSGVQVFEVDQSATQEWKQRRLLEIGLRAPPFLHFVPVDFEEGNTWLDRLGQSGFDFHKQTLVASTGVSMYLTKAAILAMLKQVASLAEGSKFVMSFLLPLELNDPEFRPGVERAAAGAKANGTPWLSFFTPDEILDLARQAGFGKVEHVSAVNLTERYFSDRTDGLRPPRNSEELLVATR